MARQTTSIIDRVGNVYWTPEELQRITGLAKTEPESTYEGGELHYTIVSEHGRTTIPVEEFSRNVEDYELTPLEKAPPVPRNAEIMDVYTVFE